MKYRKQKFSTNGLILAITIVFCCLLACNPINKSQEVLVKVNGEPIMKEDVDVLYKQYERTGIDYNEIITNSIRDLILIQWGRKMNVSVTDDEIGNMIQDLQESYPAYYDLYLNSYGKVGMKQKFKNICFYNKSIEAMTEWIKKNYSEEQWGTPDKMSSIVELMIDELVLASEIQYCNNLEARK